MKSYILSVQVRTINNFSLQLFLDQISVFIFF